MEWRGGIIRLPTDSAPLGPVKLNTCGDALVILPYSTVDVKRGPYLVSNVMLLVGIGALLIAIPYFLRL